MHNIRHIFFDLDRTLWDFETNSRRIITDLFHEHNLENRCNTSSRSFITSFETINGLLWNKYRNGEISKQQLRSSRFYNSMQQFGYDDFELGYRLEEEYVKRSPYQKALVPGALEMLELMKQRFSLHIITNGFREVQHIKLEHCGLKHFFEVVIISEEVGVAKPDPAIFLKAMEKAGAQVHESLMVGDDLEIDVRGALAAGMKAVHLNTGSTQQNSTDFYSISALHQLKDLFPSRA